MIAGVQRLTFSHDIFSAQRTGGISRCMLELMRALADEAVDWTAWVGSSSNDLLEAAENEAWANGRFIRGKTQSWLLGRFTGVANEVALAGWMRRNPPSVLHRTYFPLIDLAGRGVRRVATLHDMWDERAARNGDHRAALRSHVKRAALDRADLIVCISEHTRQELVSIWPWAEPKSLVIHHGVRPLAERPFPIIRSLPFFLFVGRRSHYKNFQVAVAALAKANLPDHELVCFGDEPLSQAELEMVARYGLSERVHRVAGGDDRLAAFYESAEALLYPSSYEGFGLPLLEAMIHGCPVITTSNTALPEVAGDAAIYADPSDAAAWPEALFCLAMSNNLRSEMVKKGQDRAAMFSWSATARAHMTAYATLA